VSPFEIAWAVLKMPQEAREFAAQAHGEQMYGDEPYMTHVEDVAGGFTDPLLQRIAYLHDVVEDTGVGLDEIHERFGPEVGSAIDALTRREGEQYFQFIQRAKEHPHARQIKLADLQANLQRSPHESLARRYRKAIEILRGDAS